MFSFIALWFFIIIFVVLVLLSGLIGRGARPAYQRAQKRPLILRWICGSLAGFLLVALLVGTFMQSRQPYRKGKAQKLEVLEPVEAAVLTEEGLAAGRFDFILRHTAGIMADDILRPLEVQETRFQWPEDREKIFSNEIRIGNQTGEWSFTTQRMYIYPRMEEMEFQLSVTKEFRTGSSHSSSSGGMRFGEERILSDSYDRSVSFSLIPKGTQRMAILVSVRPILRSDPGTPGQVSAEITLDRNSISRVYRSGREVGMFALMAWMGPVFILFFLIAGLGAQCFRARGLGFTVCLTGLMLVLVLTDKLNQNYQLHQAENKTFSPAQRELAQGLSNETFFFERE